MDQAFFKSLTVSGCFFRHSKLFFSLAGLGNHIFFYGSSYAQVNRGDRQFEYRHDC